MRISETWLRQTIDPAIDTATLVNQLTMAGLEVDGVETACVDFSRVVVGQIVSVEPHPNADRLRVCRVSVGEPDHLQIVCGANNAAEELRVPTALVGALLPGEREIKASELRGVASSGMLCSPQELGLAEASEGLMELPANAPVGMDLREYLDLDDQVIDIDLTPNRADCLSIEGVAREVAVINRIDWSQPVAQPNPVDHENELPITVTAEQECPCYLGRLITGVDPAAQTPLWMQERLRRAGLRSLGPLIDVTNYVLLELGQPLHAFDAEKIQGGIVVRYARQGEKLLLLNDEEIELSDSVLVIADESKPLALAGIMGGQDSAVSDSTVNIFLECAFFSPRAILGKARIYGLHTDSSHRFERGVDPNLSLRAIERASQLIKEIAGGHCGAITQVRNEQQLPECPEISLRAERIEKILGSSIANSEIETILQRLGMIVVPDSGERAWIVRVPSYRFDLAIEADLIEEIGRIVGYNNLPVRKLSLQADLALVPETRIELDAMKDLLIGRGYHEAITYSFVDPDLNRLIEPEIEAMELQNPISADLAVMRTSLWCGLLGAAQKNLNRQQNRIRIFETGLIFKRAPSGILQQKCLAGLLIGSVEHEQWGHKSVAADFYDIKADVEALLDLTGFPFRFVADVHPALHPGQCAQIFDSEDQPVGWIGMLHPRLGQRFGLDSKVFLYQLDQEGLQRRSMPKFEALSRFPQVRRDLAVIVAEDLSANQLVEGIYSTQRSELKSVNIFDVYRGSGVESGRKSVALSLIFQDSFRTLKDSEIDAIVSEILKNLKQKFDASLRE